MKIVHKVHKRKSAKNKIKSKSKKVHLTTAEYKLKNIADTSKVKETLGLKITWRLKEVAKE